jgi:hypothetical protein
MMNHRGGAGYGTKVLLVPQRERSTITENQMTDVAHTSIREPQNVARLSHTFAKSLCARDLAEPLASLDDSQPITLAVELMRVRNLNVLGVRSAGLVAGWIGAGDLAGSTLSECARKFHREEVLDESASLDVVLGALAASEQVFIEWRGEVAAVITRRDLQKPPLRMWLFGAITVLDANLTWAVGELHPDDSWQSQITPGRLEKAVALRAERQRRGSECALLDCLQIKDKADILMSDSASLAALGLTSRREGDRLTRDIEKLRNHLAHAQELEAGQLATAAKLASFIHSILGAEGVQRILALRRMAATQP